jgi:hypothetical protein
MSDQGSTLPPTSEQKTPGSEQNGPRPPSPLPPTRTADATKGEDKPKPKDLWDKVDIIAKAAIGVTTITIAAFAAYFAFQTNTQINALKERELASNAANLQASALKNLASGSDVERPAAEIYLATYGIAILPTVEALMDQTAPKLHDGGVQVATLVYRAAPDQAGANNDGEKIRATLARWATSADPNLRLGAFQIMTEVLRKQPSEFIRLKNPMCARLEPTHSRAITEEDNEVLVEICSLLRHHPSEESVTLLLRILQTNRLEDRTYLGAVEGIKAVIDQLPVSELDSIRGQINAFQAQNKSEARKSIAASKLLEFVKRRSGRSS